MDTLGTITKRVCSKEESWSIHEGFVAAVAMPAYTIVKLVVATGELTPVTGVTDKPFGILAVGAKAAGDQVTAHTPFVAIVRGIATAKITLGDDVAAAGMAATDEMLTKYTKAVTTNAVVGCALTGAAQDAEVWVGIYRVFVKI